MVSASSRRIPGLVVLRPYTVIGLLLIVTAAVILNGRTGGSADPRVLNITEYGDAIAPTGGSIAVSRNQPITLDFTTDVAGEVLIRTKPEQVVHYDAGITRVPITPFRAPGSYAVVDKDSNSTLFTVCIR